MGRLAAYIAPPVYDEDGFGLGSLIVLRDATERKRVRDEEMRLLTLDPLTSLFNRAYFNRRIDEQVELAFRNGHIVLLMMGDLDRFKVVNDTLGHQVGDELLAQVAQRIRQVSRESDLIARLGGDEFAVLHSNAESLLAGGAHAEKICQAIAFPFHIDGHEILIGASIGVAAFPDDAASVRSLIRKADLALYKAKQGGRSRFCYFTDELD